MIALQQNDVTRSWRAIAEQMKAIKGILCVSAHWLTRGVAVTADSQPRTIHDFGGFSQAMFDIIYPAHGSEALVKRVQELLSPEPVTASHEWGYDHGCWTVLMKAFPEADIPVIQLSLDTKKTARQHYETGQRLRCLRDEGILIMGSGNIVHNLNDVIRSPGVRPHPYAANFGRFVRDEIENNRVDALVDYPKMGADARKAVPTPDHLWPLFYVLGARHPDDKAIFENSFIEFGSIDMTTVIFRDAV